MNHPLPDEISLVGLSNCLSGDVASGIASCSWEEISRIFTRHAMRESKDGPCFMPVRMKPRDQWALSKPKLGSKSRPGYRNDENIDAVTMVVLDLDREGARELAEAAFYDNEYVLYSTHSYSPRTPHKYRIIMPVSEPISTLDWPIVFKELAHKVGADLACSNVSRIFYYPSASPSKGLAPISRHHKGAVLDVKKLITAVKTREQELAALGVVSPGQTIGNGRRTRRIAAPHFAGEDFLPNPAHYRLYSLERRHKESIDRLRDDDSRHHFAMTVIAREISRFGLRTDIPRLVQFLFYGAREYGTRSIDTGNTLEEIPELIMSAWAKFGLRNRQFAPVSTIGEAITDAIACAFDAQESQRWDFQDGPEPPPPALIVDAPNDDPVIFAKQMVETGIEKIGPNVRLADIARNCLDALCPDDPGSIVSKLTAASEQIRPENGPWTAEQFDRFWRGALVRAAAPRSESSPSP